MTPEQFPLEIVPETFGLLHEYHTTKIIAEAHAALRCPPLAELAGNDVAHAHEPGGGPA